MNYYVAGIPVSDELYHHGIKGQRWGIRRYQNPDGTLTEEGKQRYGTVENFNKSREDRKRKLKTALKVGASKTGLVIGAGASATAAVVASQVVGNFGKIAVDQLASTGRIGLGRAVGIGTLAAEGLLLTAGARKVASNVNKIIETPQSTKPLRQTKNK